MEEMPSNLLSRKRKRFPSSISWEPSTRAVTRSQYRLLRDCSGNSSTGNLQKSQLNDDSSPKKPNRTRCPNLENGALFYLSIKDLRARGRRVFSPRSAEVQNALGIDFGDGISDGSLNNSGGSVLGFKDLGPGFCASYEEEEKCQNGGRFHLGLRDSEVGSGNQAPMGEKDMGTTRINQLDSGKDFCEIKKEGSTPSTMVRKPCSRGKVFKSPSLFSYRRLLPFLADMVKEESCTLISNVAHEDPKGENSINVSSSSSPVSTDYDSSEHEHIAEDSNGIRPSNNGHVQKDGIKLEVVLPLLDDLDKGLPQIEEAVSLTDVPGRINENGITKGNVLIEEHIQTTPPDSNILSEMGLCNTKANAEVNLKTQKPFLVCSPKGNDSSNHDSAPEKVCPSPTRRTNTISTTKLVLNPCSRSKIYKTSNSFSIRRLLPYLMDVAKGSVHNDASPNSLKNMESCQNSVSFASSDNDVNVKEIKPLEFQEKQPDKCLVVEFPTSANAASDGDCMEESAPVISPSSEISLGKANSACSEDVSEPGTLNGSLKEKTSLLQHVQLIETNDSEGKLNDVGIQVCIDECNQTVDKLCSSINQTWPGRSRLEGSRHQPLDTVKSCNSDDLVCHEGELNWVKSVTSDQSPSKNGVVYFKRIENPTKGILKRNPRGCRGICNCLNCSSFRLHAERAFEFSKNQMLDAEEVALMLIDELGKLRDTLERSAVVGNDHANIQVNQLQVKELCKKSLAVEQQAKQRLSKMNLDLRSHCKTTPLERPRVKFARYIEVKSIPERNSQEAPNVMN